MKIKTTLLIVLGGMLHFTPMQLQSKNDKSLAIERTTHLIFRRYYFIARLEKTIKLIREVVSNAPRNDIKKITNCSEMPHFSHTLILQAAYRIKQANSLKPILVVWDDFSSYKSLEDEIIIGKDDLFIKEFGQQLFFIAKNILSINKPTAYKVVFNELNTIEINSAEEILDALDYLVELIQLNYSMFIRSDKIIHQDIKIHATADEINTRFYHIERLSPIIDIIHSIGQIKSPRYRSIYHIKKSTIQHINTTWSQIKQYQKVGDKNYMKTFCIFLLNALKSIYQHNLAESTQDSFFENIEIEDILYSLDVIADELDGMMQEYHKQENPSFKEWIATYWWIPLGTLSSIAFKILYHHYIHQKQTL